MSRLTHKDFNNNYYCYKTRDDFIDGYFTRENKEWFYGNVVNKLGKLEDLEEELGCPLEVAFLKTKELKKQNKYGEYCICNWYGDWVIIEIDISIIGEIECSVVCYLPDYQKTWWLKGEKNE